MAEQREVMDDLEELLRVLPRHIQETLGTLPDLVNLIEIVLDLGRRPEARFPDRFVYLSDEFTTPDELDHVVSLVGDFGIDNRAGIERTLHRISGIRNRNGDIIGLTCRIGRAVFGTIDIIRDVVETGQSILLLGRPGVGKTTMLREVARVLADEFSKRVVIVDTSNEIAGDGDVPHPAIGHARRMQVPFEKRQADVMIEAVENHMPEVIVIDEIGTEDEAQAARTIAERGVQLIGTAHGNTLENLVVNPTLSDLIGGIQAVTLGDEEARKRGTQKTVLERKAPPTYDIVIEIQSQDTLAIHHDVAKKVDLLLRGIETKPEVRRRDASGGYDILQASNLEEVAEAESKGIVKQAPVHSPHGIVRLFPYAVNRNRLEKAIQEVRAPIQVVSDLQHSDMVLTLKGQYRKMPKKLREAEQRGMPIQVIRSNTVAQIQNFIEGLPTDGEQGEALLETEQAVKRVQAELIPVELTPRTANVRKVQHELIAKNELASTSVGAEPNRRVMILPRRTT